MIDAVRFDSLAPGPRLLLLGGVHGEENPGILALTKLLEEFHAGKHRLLRGQVTIAARVNAAAAKKGVHFVDENLNRIVRRHEKPATHEQNLANELVELIEGADAVLDLHGTQAPTRPFVFLDDESNRSWAQALGADCALLGWPALYAGGLSVTTTEFAQSRGKKALTIEVGQNDDESCAALGRGFALRTLAHFGLIAPMPAAPAARELRLTTVVGRSREGKFVRPWKNFDAVRENEVIAEYSDGAELAAPHAGFVVMPYEAAAIGEEWFYLAVPG